MYEYISKEKIIAHMKKESLHFFNSYYKGYMEAINEIIEFEPADVQTVKRGFWKALMMSEETGWDLSLTGGHDAVCEYVCSVCGKPAIVDEFGKDFLPDYCPNCGARMGGDPCNE